jgi:hypothetical protein
MSRFFKKINPFSKAPAVCDNLCGAYPQGCPTCDQNKTSEQEEAKGVAA